MYSVIDNAANVQQRRKGLNNVFDDDCGAQDSKSISISICKMLIMVDDDQSQQEKLIGWHLESRLLGG